MRIHDHSRLLVAAMLLVIGFAPPLLAQAFFETPVIASPFADGTYWYLREPLVWRAFDGRVVVVPAGFVTDFASVPKAVWNVLPKWEKCGPGAVVHDYLYWQQEQPREKADKYFLEAMSDNKVGWIKRKTIYGAVWLFGGLSWRANTRDKKANRVRILERDDWPSRPSETWKALRERIEREKPEAEIEIEDPEPEDPEPEASNLNQAARSGSLCRSGLTPR